MKKDPSVLKVKLIEFICFSILPVFYIIVGIINLSNILTINAGFVISFFIIPLISIAFIALCVFIGKKTWKRRVLSGVVLNILVWAVLYSSIFATSRDMKFYEGEEAKQQYTAFKNDSIVLPELSELGKPSKIEYYDTDYTICIFFSETNYLICQYTDEDYELQKSYINSKYTFQKETIVDEDSNCYPAIEIDGYQFRLLSFEEYNSTLHYPLYVVLIGYSDENKEIVYVVYDGEDLDYIDSLEDFINDECGWENIR